MSALRPTEAVDISLAAIAAAQFGDEKPVVSKGDAEHVTDHSANVAEAARRFVRVLSNQEALSASRRATALAEETANAVQARVQAAKVPKAEEVRAQAQLARVRLDQEHAEHELASSRQRLAALWGSTQPDFADVRGDLLALPTLESFESVRARLRLCSSSLSEPARERSCVLEARKICARRSPSVAP